MGAGRLFINQCNEGGGRPAKKRHVFNQNSFTSYCNLLQILRSRNYYTYNKYHMRTFRNENEQEAVKIAKI